MKMMLTWDLDGVHSSDAPATQFEDEPTWLANREVEVGLRNLAAVT